MPDRIEPFLHVFDGDNKVHIRRKKASRNADCWRSATYFPFFLSARRNAPSLAAFSLLSTQREFLFFSRLLS